MTAAIRPTTNDQRPTMRIAVLASGRGTNLQAIIDACDQGTIPGPVVAVVSDNPKAGALTRARASGIPVVVLSLRTFPTREKFEQRLVEALHSYAPDLICLAGFMRILSPSVVQQFSGRIMNIHPALLPAFGGVGMYGEHVHRAVLDRGVRVSGCTVHFVDDVPDGGPIILQAAVRVDADDTVATLAARIAEVEHQLYPEAIRLFAEGRLLIDGRRVHILEERERGIAGTWDRDLVGSEAGLE
ncbi:MAG TPA: phosphoribosylglycinamide formyltransferase [bacterium]